MFQIKSFVDFNEPEETSSESTESAPEPIQPKPIDVVSFDTQIRAKELKPIDFWNSSTERKLRTTMKVQRREIKYNTFWDRGKHLSRLMILNYVTFLCSKFFFGISRYYADSSYVGCLL